MTIEERLKQILGEQQFQLAAMLAQLDELRDKIKKLEELVPKPKEVDKI